MQGTSNFMGGILDSLKAAPGEAYNFAKDGVGSIAGTIASTFSADNVARAVLPPVLGDMAANFIDRRRKRKEEKKRASERVSDADDDEDEDEEFDASPETIDADIGDVVQDIDVNVEDLADAIHEGFDDTNENLDRIFDILSEQEEEQEEETKSTFELVGVNGQILSSIEQIAQNTKTNELDTKLAHHNRRKEASQAIREKVSDKIGAKKSTIGDKLGGHIATKFLEGVGETFLGTALAGGMGAALMPKILSKLFGKKAVGVPTAASAATTTSPAKPSILSKLSGAMGNAKNAVVDKVSSVGASAKNSVVDRVSAVGASAKTGAMGAIRGASDFAVNAKNSVVGAVSGGAKTIAEQAKTFAGAAKGIVSKLSAPLTIAATGYQAYDIAGSDRTEEEKAKEYTKLAGATGGMLVGAKVGAALGALTGPLAPIAVPVLGILGGALGYAGGEKTGEAGHDLLMGDNSSNIKEKLSQAIGGNTPSALPGTDYNSVMNYSPEIKNGDVVANASKTERLENLTKQIEAVNADNGTMANQTTIVPVQINTPSAPPQQSSQQEQKTFHIPATRNQDGTIQRLLDDNFTPMFR